MRLINKQAIVISLMLFLTVGFVKAATGQSVEFNNPISKVVQLSGFEVDTTEGNGFLKVHYLDQSSQVECSYSLIGYNLELDDRKAAKKLLSVLEVDYKDKVVLINDKEFGKSKDEFYTLVSENLAVMSEDKAELCTRILLEYSKVNPSILSELINTIETQRNEGKEVIPKSKIVKDKGFFAFIKDLLSKLKIFSADKSLTKLSNPDSSEMEKIRKEKYG